MSVTKEDRVAMALANNTLFALDRLTNLHAGGVEAYVWPCVLSCRSKLKS